MPGRAISAGAGTMAFAGSNSRCWSRFRSGINALAAASRSSIHAEYRYIAPHSATLLDDIPAWPLPQEPKGETDVAKRGAQAGAREGISYQERRYRFARSPGRHFVGTDQLPDQTLQDPRQGQPFPARSVEARLATSQPPRLSEVEGRSALQEADRAARHSPVIRRRAGNRASRGFTRRLCRRITMAEPESWQDRWRLPFRCAREARMRVSCRLA